LILISIIVVILLLSREEKEKLVIQLAHEGKTAREIAKQVHISLRDIGKIIRKETGDDDLVSKEKQKHDGRQREKEKRLKFLSPYARSFQMFKDRMALEDVAIELDLIQTLFYSIMKTIYVF
jgi:transposase